MCCKCKVLAVKAEAQGCMCVHACIFQTTFDVANETSKYAVNAQAFCALPNASTFT